MNKRKSFNQRLAGLACGALLAGGASAEVIYTNDFEMGLRSNESSFSAYFSTNWKNNVNSSGNDRWGVHDQSTNCYASGSCGATQNANMDGNVMGHIYANYREKERSFYEITLDFTGWDTGAKSKSLMFDFDTWIDGIGGDDGFNVSAYNGNPVNTGKPTLGSTNMDSNEMPGSLPAAWELLNPITSLAGWDASLTGGMTSDMVYDDTLSYSQLDEVSGSLDSSTGHGGSDMAGTALFDLSNFTGLTTIRFSFGSGSSSSVEEGINIDNVKFAGLCGGTVGGNPGSSGGASCGGTPPGSSVPEPASLALAALGLVAVRRKGLRLRK